MRKRLIIIFLLCATFLFIRPILEIVIPGLWKARTHVTHPIYYTIRSDNKKLTEIFSSLPYFKNNILKEPIKGDCLGSPVDTAIRNKANDHLKILLNHHATLNGCWPAVLRAIQENNYDALLLLADSGANLEEQWSGSGFLAHASARCDVKNMESPFLEFLIDRGLDINQRSFYEGDKNFQRETPLYLAAHSNCVENVRFLLKHGADKSLPIYGKTIVEVLKNDPMNRHDEVIKLLED